MASEGSTSLFMLTTLTGMMMVVTIMILIILTMTTTILKRVEQVDLMTVPGVNR